MQPWGSGVLQAEPLFFAAAKNGIGRGPRCRYGRCRRNNSLLRQRKLESDADLVAATTDAGGPFLTAAAMTLHPFRSLGLKSRIDARNRLFSGKSLHRFPSLGLKSRIDAAFGLFLRVSLHRFPSLGLKSRINARKRGLSRVLPELAESLHRKKKSPSLV